MSRIITFYSFKGGVGRTFALANIAVLLARRGKRVLLMDWDLEAPGLHRYFKSFLEPAVGPSQGLIHILTEAERNDAIPWRNYITEIKIPDSHPIHLIPSGDQAPDYIDRVRGFSWSRFFENHEGGDLLNRWRSEWKSSYDFVLIDSRTGITDTGGVCTIYLPDILVLVFSANEQSFERGVQLVSGVQKARRDLDVQRPPLAILPLPGRFDGRDEVDEAQVWLNRFTNELKPFYDDWLPKHLNPRQIIELTKVPYVTKFSFGEPLPVLTQGVSDPEFPGFYLENITRLLSSDFQDAQNIVSPETPDRNSSIVELRSLLASIPIDESAVSRAVDVVKNQVTDPVRVSELLIEAGVSLLRQQRFSSAEHYIRQASQISANVLGTDHPLVRSSRNHLAELLMTTGRLDEAEFLYRQLAETATEESSRIAIYTNLANIYRQMGRSAEALDWFERTLRVVEANFPRSDPAVLATHNSLAALNREMGRSSEAVEWYERALRIAEGYSRPGDPTVIAAYNNLAGLYREMGRSAEAIEWYERALHIAEANSRPGDPAVLAACNNLAGLYREMGRSMEAVDLYERALRAAEKYSRPGDPIILTAYNNLAGLYREIGRSAEAVDWYERALRIAEVNSRPGDPAVLAACNNLASLYRETGRDLEAVSWYQHAIQAAEMSSRPGDPTVLSTYNNLADLFRQMGRPEEALSWYRRAWESSRNAFGPESAQTVSQIINLSDLLIENGHFEEAENLLRSALANLRPSIRSQSSIGSRIRANLARLLHESGRNNEANEISENARFDVFVSYSSKDRRAVRPLVEKLTERGIRVWFDQHQLRLGDSISRVVSDALKYAPAFLICIGEGKQSPWMQHELSTFVKDNSLHRLVIPVLLPGASFESMPPELSQYKALDLREGFNVDEIENLSRTIRNRRDHTTS